MITKKNSLLLVEYDAMPEKLQRCIDSWKMKLPDYEIIKWDLKKLPLEKSIWVRQAYERKK
jgi:mannosyltransferase OCH1-like enzyme